MNKNKIQEAVTFIGRRGISYVTNSASLEEKAYFSGILYNDRGVPLKNFISSCQNWQNISRFTANA